MLGVTMNIDVEQFQRDGFVGPFKIFDHNYAEALLKDRFYPDKHRTWYKSTHEKSERVNAAGALPALVTLLKPLLGENILMWASHFISQPPQKRHDWHLDVEHGGWDGVTVWAGLKNLNEKTVVSVITRSHHLKIVPQQLKKLGVDTGNSEAILAEAKKEDPLCELKTFTLNPGEIIIWSGRVWHFTSNKSDKTRHSIIYQYCTPDQVTKIPLNYDYPDTKWSATRPPCVLVSGVDTYRRNVVLPNAQKLLTERVSFAAILNLYKTRRALGDLVRFLLKRASI